MFYGKLVAGVLGFLVFGLFGLVLGVAVGHAFDKGLGITLAANSPEQLQKIQAVFFEACFTLLGYLAKADGRVSEEEIQHTEQIMVHLGVAGSHRDEAIAYFKAGAQSDFQPEELVARFMEVSHGHKQVHQTMLVFLVSMAQADGTIDEVELRTLEQIAAYLGFSPARFASLMEQVQAQHAFQQRREERVGTDRLAQAYAALAVSPSCDDRELKRAYRKLMSQNHPDKLIAQGVPEDMIKLATATSQEIQAAYETIVAHRKQSR